VLHALGADVNKCDNDSMAPITAAAGPTANNTERVCLCMQLGADVRPLLHAASAGSTVIKIVQEGKSLLEATVLHTSEHQFTLYSLARLTAYYLQRHASKQPQDTIDKYTLRLAAAMQDSLVVSPFEAATDKARRRRQRESSSCWRHALPSTQPWHTQPKRANRSMQPWWWR
jgi:hypothetical protein